MYSHPSPYTRTHRVSEKGTIQLSIDADSVRRLLLEFPKAARPLDDPSEFASYAHHVEREMGGAINLVKVLQVWVGWAGGVGVKCGVAGEGRGLRCMWFSVLLLHAVISINTPLVGVHKTG